MNEKLSELRKKAMSLPLTPGVYLMKDKSGTIIYVGKAKALKNRVSQYFGSQNTHTPKVKKMVENVDDFDYILCDTEFEALILECSLIKQHSPKYNILLKDDKGYSYIKVKEDGWKEISIVRKTENDGSKYIGPYLSSFGISNAVDTAKKVFKLPQCGKVFPRDYKKSRPCLNFSIGQCSAPCAGKIGIKEHNESVDNAVKFITDGSGELVDYLTSRMNEYAENMEYEKAAKVRDRINAIKKINDKQKVVDGTIEEQDVFAIVGGNENSGLKSCLSVMRFRDFKLYDSEHFIIDYPENLSEARHELIREYYSMRENVPKRVTVDGDVEDAELLSEWLTSLAGRKVSVFIPQRGDQHSLVELCKSNAAQKLALYLGGRGGKVTASLDELGKLLGLKSPPEYIESYDISHTAGENNVAGMVVFKNGVPYKKSYRRFSIKGFSGQDDYASMAEVINRRLCEYEKADDHSEGFGVLPSLILLDGGKGQVNAVLPVLKAHNLDIPIFGMVKDNHHRTRAIATSGDEIALTSKRSAFTLVSTIQEEVHRYSIDYHRKKNKASTISTTLVSIDGIGEKRAKELLKYFKTIKAISEADVEELCCVKGMTSITAQAVYDAFHS